MLHGVSSSDWHLQAYESYFNDGSALSRQMTEIRKPYMYAFENGIKHVFVPGDLSNIPRLDERYLIALIAHFVSVDNHIDTHYVLGNHDFARVGKTSMDVLKSMVDNKFFKRLHLHYVPTVQKIDGVYVTFLPFPHVELPEKRPTLIFAHVETPGAVGDNGYPVRGGQSVERHRGDFMISGHLHTYQFLKNSNTLFNGSLTQRNFGESLPKGWVDFKCRHGERNAVQVKHSFINAKPEFTFNTVTINEQSDWESLSDNPNMLYRIYTGEGIVVPRSVTKSLPNIISIYSADRKKRVEDMERHAEKSISDIPKFGPTTHLAPFLRNLGLSKTQMSTAKGMVREALSELGM